MAREFHLRVLAADRPFYEGACVSLTVPAVDGSMGILAGHSNTIAALVPGAMSVTLSLIHISTTRTGSICWAGRR